MEQDRNVIPVEPWMSLQGKLQEKSNPPIRTSCQETGPQVPGAWRGRVLGRSAYKVWPIRKLLVVMSQWAHCPWNLDSPEAAPPWPVSVAAQPATQDESRRRRSCLVWKSSQLSWAQGNRAGTAGAHGWPEHIRIWGFHSSPGSLCYHAPWFGVSTGICALWAWISTSRKGHPDLTLVHRLPWFPRLTLNTQSHGEVLADCQGRKYIT
jgi:hypothetical protein